MLCLGHMTAPLLNLIFSHVIHTALLLKEGVCGLVGRAPFYFSILQSKNIAKTKMPGNGSPLIQFCEQTLYAADMAHALPAQ